MKIDYNKIKAGDIIIDEGEAEYTVKHVWQKGVIVDETVESFIGFSNITDHKPAEAKTEAEGLTNPTPAHATQPVGEWLDADDWFLIQAADNSENQRKNANKRLTKKHGQPPMNQVVHTYNGELASEWGLEEDSWVLVFSDGRYIDMRYAHLRMGDQWLPMPPAPKPTTEE